MICDGCKVERMEGDFLPGHDKCFRCVYKEKMLIVKQIRKCKICTKPVPKTHTKFCSDECAKVQHASDKKNYWQRKIIAPLAEW